jgi:hypothetical protein
MSPLVRAMSPLVREMSPLTPLPHRSTGR